MKAHHLLPPHWKSIYLQLWFSEDFSGLDVASAVVGDTPSSASLLLKTPEAVLAGLPFVEAIFHELGCA